MDDAKRQSLIAHSWEIIVSLPNTSGLVSVSGSWGSRMSLTHMVSSSWDTNNSGFDERLNKEDIILYNAFISVPMCIIFVQRKFCFKTYLMQSCFVKVLFGCCRTDWLGKCQQQQKKRYLWYHTLFSMFI